MKEQTFQWMLQGCHSITEVAVAYFPHYQHDCSAVRALRRAVKENAILQAELEAAGYTNKTTVLSPPANISLHPPVGHAHHREKGHRK